MANKKNFKILVTGIVTVIGMLMFNSLYASDFLVDTAKNFIDTNAVKISEVYNDPSFLNLISVLPFHDSYQIWDTVMVHPYHFDLTKMTDTVTLVLNDGGTMAFMAPIAYGAVHSGFGYRSSGPHYGVDLALKTGDTIKAAFDGVVRVSEYNIGGYGNCVVIRHYNGLETIYGHMSKRLIQSGDFVKAGDVIGLGGSTGHSTGPHLHFETRYLGEAIDPASIINFGDTAGYTLKEDVIDITKSTFNYQTKYPAMSLYGARYYKIKKGDTLSGIAVKCHTTVNRLCQINRMSRNTVLRLGKTIRVR